MKIGIVADDLTGAADSSAPFANRGMRCAAVIGDLLSSDSELAAYDVVAVSTETRDVSAIQPDTMSSAMSSAVNWLCTFCRPEILSKKIDSTLRGNVALELDAICSLAGDRLPIICPAFPAQGRTVTNGILHVGGEPRRRVSKSFYSNLTRNAAVVRLEDIRRGSERLNAVLCSEIDCGASAIFFDAESDSDLEAVAAAVMKAPNRWLPVGSAGFMTAIAAGAVPAPVEGLGWSHLTALFRYQPVLFVCGSMSSVTRSQIVELERSAAVSRVSTVREAIHRMVSGSRIAITASPENEQDRAAVLENLLTGVDELRRIPSTTALFVSGGATAAALLRRLPQFSHLNVLGEFESGVVVTNAVFGSSGSTSAQITDLVLKSGAFGDAQTLARIAGL